MDAHKTPSGFTLIEMAIVLTIVALIVAAILSGQSLVRQSQLNSAMADEQRYIQAVASFQQKYNALPGDFASATSYWTAYSSGCTTYPGSSGAGSTTTTCNGDGNGQIGVQYSNGSLSANFPEEVLFWQHLAMAQMIPGSYNASTGAGTSTYSTDHQIGTNSPASKLPGAGFGVEWIGVPVNVTAGLTYEASAVFSAASTTLPNMGHIMTLGGYNKYSVPVAPIMTGTEAAGIDSKFDDGSAYSGNIQTWYYGSTLYGGNAYCALASNSPSTAYATYTGASYTCSLLFITGF